MLAYLLCRYDVTKLPSPLTKKLATPKALSTLATIADCRQYGQCLTIRRFKSDRDESCQDCSSSKYTFTEGVGFSGFLMRRHTFKMAAMT